MKFIKSIFVFIFILASAIASTASATPDGVLRSLGSSETATDILYTYCPAPQSTNDKFIAAFVLIKDRYPPADPLLRVRIQFDDTPSTPCPSDLSPPIHPEVDWRVGYDYSDSIFPNEKMGLLYPYPSDNNSGYNSFKDPSGVGSEWYSGQPAFETNATPEKKYCIYVDKVASYADNVMRPIRPGQRLYVKSFTGIQRDAGPLLNQRNQPENYELNYYCTVATSTGYAHPTVVPAIYQQNQ